MDSLQGPNHFESIRAVGHRVVHGMQHTTPELVTQALLDDCKDVLLLLRPLPGRSFYPLPTVLSQRTSLDAAVDNPPMLSERNRT